MRKLRVLFLGTNISQSSASRQRYLRPVDADVGELPRLDLEEECRAIEREIRRGGKYRNYIDLRQSWCVRKEDIIQEITVKAPDVLHFSCHGSEGGILLLDRNGAPSLLSRAGFLEVLDLFKERIRLVFLNSCDTHTLAAEAAEIVGCAIGMGRAILDDDALTFSSQFYLELSNTGRIDKAFDTAVKQMKILHLASSDAPRLFPEKSADPASLSLFGLKPVVQRGTLGPDLARLEALISFDDINEVVDGTRGNVTFLNVTRKKLWLGYYYFRDEGGRTKRRLNGSMDLPVGKHTDDDFVLGPVFLMVEHAKSLHPIGWRHLLQRETQPTVVEIGLDGDAIYASTYFVEYYW